jgi:hypothetical protein
VTLLTASIALDYTVEIADDEMGWTAWFGLQAEGGAAEARHKSWL